MDWTEILIKIAEVCLVPILGILTNYIVIFVKAKCAELAQKANNDKIVKYIDLFNQMICDCVIATNQTYVDALKAQGAFDLEAQKIAFNKTKEAIINKQKNGENHNRFSPFFHFREFLYFCSAAWNSASPR